MADVGFHGLTNLRLPVRIWVDGVANLVRQVLDIGVQQLEKALLFTGELTVERALRRAGVTNDVGDGGGAVSALGDRGGEAVEQATSKRVDIGGPRGSRRSRIVCDGGRHVVSF